MQWHKPVFCARLLGAALHWMLHSYRMVASGTNCKCCWVEHSCYVVQWTVTCHPNLDYCKGEVKQESAHARFSSMRNSLSVKRSLFLISLLSPKNFKYFLVMIILIIRNVQSYIAFFRIVPCVSTFGDMQSLSALYADPLQNNTLNMGCIAAHTEWERRSTNFPRTMVWDESESLAPCHHFM